MTGDDVSIPSSTRDAGAGWAESKGFVEQMTMCRLPRGSWLNQLVIAIRLDGCVALGVATESTSVGGRGTIPPRLLPIGERLP